MMKNSIQTLIFAILPFLLTFNSFSQCTTSGNEPALTSAVVAPTCGNQTVGVTNGIGPGSRKIYSGFTAGNALKLYVNSGSAVINCVQARWLNAASTPIGGWFAINYANATPGTYTNQTVPAGADRLEVTTGRTTPTSWVATSAVLNYRLQNTGAGDPTLFGQNTWNVYAYNANTNFYDPPVTGVQYTNLDNSVLTYAGWYTHNTFNINTGTVFNPAVSPSDAPGYVGCPVNYDNHVFVYKRRGFPCGTYNIGNFSHDDAVNILVDGVSVYQTTACCASNPNLNLDLGGNSTVEIRLGENAGSSHLEVNFVPIINNLSVNNDIKTCYVTANSGWNNFTVGNGRLLASIDPGASTLGNVEVTSYVAGSPFLVNACAPLYNPTHETAVLGRSWIMNPVTQPTNPVRVRLYFDQSEHTALVPLSGTSSSPDDLTSVYSDLRLSKYHHPTNVGVNGSWADNCANIPSGQMSIWVPVGSNTINSLFTGFDANGRYTEYLITPPAFSEFWLHGSSVSSPLAVTLSDFSASCESNETRIFWTTASEQNSDYFVVERSRNGHNWDVIATVDGAGKTSKMSQYAVTDSKVGQVYYRLRQFDFDGSNETFGPIHVNCENAENTLIVYPNPTSSDFTVALNSTESLGGSTIFVQDLNGKTVSQRDVNILSGTNTVLFEGEQLMHGTYIISVKGKDTKVFVPVRLIIQ